MDDHLTLIFTTSPVPTAPSTELLSEVLHSFAEYCPTALQCSVVIVIDTYERVTERSRLKKGCVTPQGAANFKDYKDNVKKLILEAFLQRQNCDLSVSISNAEFGSSFEDRNSVILHNSQTDDGRVTFIEAQARLGFGLAVRSALRVVRTPYVWVHQHDWTLQTCIPIEQMVDVMKAYNEHDTAPIRYICLPSIRLLGYAAQSDNMRYPRFRELTSSLKGEFSAPGLSDSQVSLPLTPLFCWFDKPHIASTEHYFKRVFPSRVATRRGAFIEDTVGQKARTQIKENSGQFTKWATWLYNPDDGNLLCLRHLDGRVWKGTLGEEQSIRAWRRQANVDELPTPETEEKPEE